MFRNIVHALSLRLDIPYCSTLKRPIIFTLFKTHTCKLTDSEDSYRTLGIMERKSESCLYKTHKNRPQHTTKLNHPWLVWSPGIKWVPYFVQKSGMPRWSLSANDLHSPVSPSLIVCFSWLSAKYLKMNDLVKKIAPYVLPLRKQNPNRQVLMEDAKDCAVDIDICAQLNIRHSGGNAYFLNRATTRLGCTAVQWKKLRNKVSLYCSQFIPLLVETMSQKIERVHTDTARKVVVVGCQLRRMEIKLTTGSPYGLQWTGSQNS